MKYFQKEIIIHSHISDVLEENHKLAYESVDCDKCGASLHAVNNECMQTWIETEFGNFCTKCFKLKDVIEYLEDCVD